ncbi:MAG: helix-turn-helix protein [Caulobacteraceae bacterium]|nr:helix-turn-helix protein [Caulobacteraceae bacterium]
MGILPAPRPGPPDDVDIAVGATIRLRRKSRGMSQAALAEAVGVSFQQVQKYERGANRASASMLSRLAVALDCSVADLFQGVPGGVALSGDDPDGFGRICRSFLEAEGAHELARLYLLLAPAHRRAVLAAARAFLQSPD